MIIERDFRRRKQLALALVLLLISAITIRSYSQHVKALKKSSPIELTSETEDDTPEDDDEFRQEFTIPESGVSCYRISPKNINSTIPAAFNDTTTLIVDRCVRFCQFCLYESVIF